MAPGAAAAQLPPAHVLDNPDADAREAFIALKEWARARNGPGQLRDAGRSLGLEHRRSIFSFLCALPTRKPIFRNQARELLKVLAEDPEWRREGVVDDSTVAEALQPPSAARPAAGASAGGGAEPPASFTPQPRGVASTVGSAPPPVATLVGPGLAIPSAPSLGPAPPVSTLVPGAPSAEPPPAGHAFTNAAASSAEPSPTFEEAEEDDVLSGMPPAEALLGRGGHEARDTFIDLRKWLRRLNYWDLCAAGSRLSTDIRRGAFTLVTGMADRRIYINQVKETLSMLLSVEEWVAGDVVDESAVDRIMGEHARKPSPSPSPPPVPPGGGRVGPAAVPAPSPSPPPPTPTLIPGKAPAAPPVSPSPCKPAVPGPAAVPKTHPAPAPAPAAVSPLPRPGGAKPPGGSLLARVEAALGGGASIANGEELVKLYKASGLGGEASLSGKATDGNLLSLVLCLAGQRLKDLYVDPLHDRARLARTAVHFPHLYIDLRARKCYKLPPEVQSAVERKISSGERWTALEKTYVLFARHEQTIRYVLAYALARAKAEKRPGAVWISLGMDTGSQGHANAVCLQARSGGRGPVRVWVYDPNYSADGGGSHWVHAKKAVGDALPGVQKLLNGTGITVEPSAELFGHGLQTALGTTSTKRSWFSRKEVTTTRGYPICGSVVFLLAAIWMAASQGSAGGLEDVVEVEAAIATVVAEGEDKKVLVQRKIAQILKELTQRNAEGGADPFASAMRRKLDKDKRDWPSNLVQGGGSITMSIPGKEPYTYTW